jgi:S-disulfanyl-L-cysteine oxidoreductase SoxD
MRILRDAFARGWDDLLLNFNRVTCPGTPSAAVMSRGQRRITAVCLAGGLALIFPTALAPAQGYPSRYDLGTRATEQEIAAVAIAIPADGKGLPPGKGDYFTGKTVYETTCAACHGKDLQGVAGLPDMPSGAALRLIGGRGTLTSSNPVATVESYWPYATTLFDYIRRAMPFSAPGSLSNDEVYAVTAYILAEGNIIEKATVIDADTLPKVQMPNRDGFIPDPRPEMFK